MKNKKVEIAILIFVLINQIIIVNKIISHFDFDTNSTIEIEETIIYCFKDKKPDAIKEKFGLRPIYCSNYLAPLPNEFFYKIMRKISWEKYICLDNVLIYSSFFHDGGGCIDPDNYGGVILQGPSLYIYTTEK
jgi:hypothetical protein